MIASVLRDGRRGSWILLVPPRVFAFEPVAERRPGRCVEIGAVEEPVPAVSDVTVLVFVTAVFGAFFWALRSLIF